jgi:hypothetical protein
MRAREGQERTREASSGVRGHANKAHIWADFGSSRTLRANASSVSPYAKSRLVPSLSKCLPLFSCHVGLLLVVDCMCDVAVSNELAYMVV